MIYDTQAKYESLKGFTKVVPDPQRERIRAILDKSMKDHILIVALFIPKRNTTYEGLKVIGCCEVEGKRIYSCSMSYSNNFTAISFDVELNDIGYLQTL
jgi:hypothetical protein